MSEQPAGHRSGFIAIAGRPNVGKSTLLNAIIGTKVAIVSPRPQTTRLAIRGILTAEDHQIVFVDTPGMHKPTTLLGERTNAVARQTVRDVDAIIVVFDAAKGIGQGDAFVAREALETGLPAICVVNKIDKAGRAKTPGALQDAAAIGQGSSKNQWREIVPVSAVAGTNIDVLKDILIGMLPEGPRFYMEGELSDVPLEIHLAELIREKALFLTREELPHSLAVQIEEIRPKREDGVTEIDAIVYVERDSQKPIVIGKRGAMLREIGTRARMDIQPIIGGKVFLHLRVMVAKEWQRDPRALNKMGF